MLILYDGSFSSTPVRALPEAEGVCVSETINGDRTLEFTLPSDTDLSGGYTVKCEDEYYRIASISETEDAGTRSVKCVHNFQFAAQRLHIPNLGSDNDSDLIGVNPYTVLSAAVGKLASSGIRLYSETELERLGLHWLGGTDTPEVLIDFESIDKTTLWDVIQQVIELTGRGELYAGRSGFALVERIGKDSGAVVSDLCNLRNVTVETDYTGMVLRLYPYGTDGLEITNAEQNATHTPYIQSPDLADYGAYFGGFEGYRDYEYDDPDKLFERALWEFDEDNPDRIDVPGVNISGSVTDIGLPERIGLGDTVTVMHSGKTLTERVISIKRYPYDGTPSEVSVGRVKKDMFFYLNQLGILAQRYANISAYNGKIYGTKVKGAIETASVSKVSDQAQKLNNTDAQIIIDAQGLRILSGGQSAFLAAAQGRFAVGGIVITDKTAIGADELELGGYAFTADADGNLYFNNKKIRTEEAE